MSWKGRTEGLFPADSQGLNALCAADRSLAAAKGRPDLKVPAFSQFYPMLCLYPVNSS